ncbi:site-specific DNA-methyltransferase [Methylomonas rapida]|uniref:Site-specific DNA-methyltransferase n=1 Tax=Methylomonas rapida TaxID=2963939 RepID=A0ABY7GKS9_9GAMM|nr:site-specific DNA-methyltransferase [Methylomonas rapida]WAR45108.1 site-specific DNA-methyltransferase [Methylomonas rapida]
MAYLEDKIQQVQDKELRDILLAEVKKLKKEKKFGLVFEEHVPELVPVFSAPIRPRATVALKDGDLLETFRVKRIKGDQATVSQDNDGTERVFPISQLVVVQRFGEAIYPALELKDMVQNGGDRPFHTLIEADNYHALQLLDYLYAGQVDCIYIDPPYNTGAKDWKYNNNYVDSNDSWRHSKWLTFMEKRLKLAKRLLKPDTGVLIVTIDEHEVHHLRCLLAQILPNAFIQMVTAVINPKGVSQGRFSRVEEYLIYCFMPSANVLTTFDDLLNRDEKRTNIPRWSSLLRSGNNARRIDRKNMFYPILIDLEKMIAVDVGEPLLDGDPILGQKEKGLSLAWPIRADGTFGNWGVGHKTLLTLIQQGFVAVRGYDDKRKTFSIYYLNEKLRRQIETGDLIITGRDEVTNVVEVEYAATKLFQPKTVWHRSIHDAGAYGSDLIKKILGESSGFTFPKSVYSTHDAVFPIVKENKSALVVDFFSGSGTTLNATNLINATDKGNRRCILVTNNEVSAEESKALQEQGFMPGDAEYEKHGICQSVTWPRSKYTILGKRDDGTLLEGDYLTGRTITKEKRRTFKQIGFIDSEQLTVARKKELVSLLDGIPQSKINKDAAFFVDEECKASILFDEAEADAYLDALEDMMHIETFYLVMANNALFKRLKDAINELLGPLQISEEEKRPMSNGFEANLAYFKLDFLDADEVQLGRKFAALLPILWLMAGAKGPCPNSPNNAPYFLPEQCPFAVLLDEHCFLAFKTALQARPGISHVFLVTNSEDGFFAMRDELAGHLQVVQLYKDYLDQFKINTQRERS